MADITVKVSSTRTVGDVNMCEVEITLDGRTASTLVQGYADLAECKALAIAEFKKLKAQGAFTVPKVHPAFPASFDIDEKDLDAKQVEP